MSGEGKCCTYLCKQQKGQPGEVQSFGLSVTPVGVLEKVFLEHICGHV